MTKNQAISIFGSRKIMAECLGITQMAISYWGEKLNKKQKDRVIGAAISNGYAVPEKIIDPISEFKIIDDITYIKIGYGTAKSTIGYLMQKIKLNNAVISEDEIVELFRRTLRNKIQGSV
jgi:hypothetical protein